MQYHSHDEIRPGLKLAVIVLAFTLVIPESVAKRIGSGRTVGRQSQMSRQRYSRPPPVVRPQPMPPYARPAPGPRVNPYARHQGMPSAYPQSNASRWGGMWTGALLGLGLGSLMSNSHAQADAARLEEARQQGIREEAARQEAVRQGAAKEETRAKLGDAKEATEQDIRSQSWENVSPTDPKKPVTPPDNALDKADARTSGNW